MNNSNFFRELLSKVAPGTELRKGIYNILDAEIGALIVVGYDEEIEKVRDGGFYINCDYIHAEYFLCCYTTLNFLPHYLIYFHLYD